MKCKPEFASIFKCISAKVSKTKFTCDTATQITLKGILDSQPLYVKVEEGHAETCPYEYRNAPFYIDADTEVFASVLSGDKSFFDALASGDITINGDARQAVLFVNSLFGGAADGRKA